MPDSSCEERHRHQVNLGALDGTAGKTHVEALPARGTAEERSVERAIGQRGAAGGTPVAVRVQRLAEAAEQDARPR